MNIVNCEVFAYSLPLTAPLGVAGKILDRRDGWLVRLSFDGGIEGWGDIAPLPGFSPEEQATVRQQLLGLPLRLRGQTVPDGFSSQAAWSVLERMPSSLVFGIESAVLAAEARGHSRSVASLLGARADDACRVNALAFGPVASCAARAEAAVRDGYTALKLKVGRGSVEEDIQRIRRVTEIVSPSVALRLDANRAWTFEQAREVASGIRGIQVAYVEEPLAEAGRLGELHEATGWPLALDESLAYPLAPAAAPSIPGVVAWVIKPTLAGGLRSARAWQRAAVERGIQPVLSSAFESGVGLSMIAELAAVHPEIAVGLDTYRSLAGDLLEPRLDFTGGRIDLARARRATLQTKRLVALS